jgi:hypothetical protein
MRGQRPRGLCDQRYDWTYLYAAVRPATGEGFALVLPMVSIRAMNLFLKRFADSLAPGVHAVLVLDQAGDLKPGNWSGHSESFPAGLLT